jgi:hypothetical protein
MSHRYSLRPHAKGRRGHQTADEPEGQVKGTTGQSTGVGSRPTTPYPYRAAHNTPIPTQDSEEDWQRTIRYRVLGPAETSEEIEAARKRVEARRIAEASRIRREQIVRGYEEDLRMLRARIKALRHECEVRVERVQRKWERDWAIDRGEVVVVVGEDVEPRGEEEEEEEEDEITETDREDEGDMAVDEDYTPTETSLTTGDDEDRQWQWPSRSVPSIHPALKLISHHPSNLAPCHCGHSSHLIWGCSHCQTRRWGLRDDQSNRMKGDTFGAAAASSTQVSRNRCGASQHS